MAQWGCSFILVLIVETLGKLLYDPLCNLFYL